MVETQLPPFVEALSGSIGASAANLLVYPLDLVTARIQTKTPQAKRQAGVPAKVDAYADLPTSLRTIYRSGGAGAFYAGVSSDTLSTALSNFLYFYIYSALHKLSIYYKTKTRRSGAGAAVQGATKFSALEELVIGALAGILSRGVTTPLSTITVRKQTAAKLSGASQAEKGKAEDPKQVEDEDEEDSEYASGTSWGIAKEILEDDGVSGFWRGYSSACALTINPAITFYLIEAFKRGLLPKRFREKPTPSQTFLISATASSLASTICYPLILAKIRLQWKSPSGKRLYNSMMDVFAKTVKRSGPTGLYVGLQTQIIKGFFAQGVTMVMKQRIELLIVRLYRLLYARARLSPA